jgi:hypothetical protein
MATLDESRRSCEEISAQSEQGALIATCLKAR